MNWWWAPMWKLSFCFLFAAGFAFHFADVKQTSQNREIASQYKFIPWYDASFKQ